MHVSAVCRGEGFGLIAALLWR